MAGSLPEVDARHVRGIDKLIAAAEALVAHPVFHDLADHGAFGVPEDEAGASQLLNAEQVQLLAKNAVVALGRFLQAREVRVEILLREEGGTVDALELGILLVAEPVGAGQVGDLDSLDAAGRGHMRATAKVNELAIAVEADVRTGLRELGDEVRLHEVAIFVELGEGLLTRLVLADKLLVARDDFGHLLFNDDQIVGGEWLLAVEVVEKACVGGRAVAELGLRKELKDGSGEDVGCGVAHHFEGLGVGLLEELELDVLGKRRSQVHQTRRGGVLGGVHGSLRLAVGGGALRR